MTEDRCQKTDDTGDDLIFRTFSFFCYKRHYGKVLFVKFKKTKRPSRDEKG
jgi:hypothetical protein